MTDSLHSLVDLHIKEYDTRLRQLDDILWKAQKRLLESGKAAEASENLAKLKQERDQLASWFRAIKLKPAEMLRKDETLIAGPMDRWDAAARHGAQLVKSIERRSRQRAH
jgi:hypothetical protein